MSERASLQRSHSGSRGSGSSSTLRLRRKKRRRRRRIALLIVVLIVLGAIVYGLWQPAVRITHFVVTGTDASSVTDIANAKMVGKRAWFLPGNSYFLVPKQEIRAAILAAHPEIGAVSISRIGFSTLEIAALPRTPVARWCGSAASSSPEDTIANEVSLSPSGSCYWFDTSGFVYAKDGIFSASSTLATSSIAELSVFDTLSTHNPDPLASTLADASSLPAVLEFARHLSTFGIKVDAIVIRSVGEVDDFVSPAGFGTAGSETRITYVLGDEQAAYTALVSAKGDLNLATSSLQYIDLRFPGKIYFK